MKDIKIIEQEMREHFYQRLQYNFIVTIPENQVELKVAYDICTDQLLAGLTLFLAGKENIREIKKEYADYPEDWTDAFKLRFFPTWILKIFPVKYRKILVQTVNTTTTRVCPHIQLQDGYYSHLKWIEYGDISIRDEVK